MNKREMTSEEGRKVVERMLRDMFCAGVIAALQVVALYDQETVWREIVNTCDYDELRNFAERDGMLELAGFLRYEATA